MLVLFLLDSVNTKSASSVPFYYDAGRFTRFVCILFCKIEFKLEIDIDSEVADGRRIT